MEMPPITSDPASIECGPNPTASALDFRKAALTPERPACSQTCTDPTAPSLAYERNRFCALKDHGITTQAVP
jgi:hypothetical protein